MKLAQEAEPLGVVVIARCDLQMDGCTAREPGPVTIVRVGRMQDQFVVCRSCLERMVQEGEWSVRGARVPADVDFQIEDSVGRTVAAVEVKGTPRTRAIDLQRWASSLRRNLAAHAAVPSSPYFLLLVVPEAGYLWSRPGAPPDATPDYTLDLQQLTLPGDVVPSENGPEAEAWARRSLEALVRRQLRPSGLWWTESGFGRVVENEELALVATGRYGAV